VFFLCLVGADSCYCELVRSKQRSSTV
jgi:hypothetical protein